MERKQSELTVITKAKDLCSYVMTVTQKSPKQFRFTFVSRLQNLALSVIENLFRANDVFVSKSDIHSQKERLSYQRSAMTDLKVLGYCSVIYGARLYSSQAIRTDFKTNCRLSEFARGLDEQRQKTIIVRRDVIRGFD